MKFYKLIFFLFIVIFLIGCMISNSIAGNEKLSAPNNLVAWQSGEYIQLRYDFDYEGQYEYNIYRSPNLDGEWEKLNFIPFPLNTFVDYNPLVYETSYYKVVRIDFQGNEGLPAIIKVQFDTMKIPIRVRSKASFNKNNIISDQQLINFSSMSLWDIQNFLSNHGSYLSTYYFNGRSAAQHIYDACQEHQISSQVVLTTLQKEQGLITSSSATQAQLNWAMGWDGSSDFGSQIYWGTKQFRRYYDDLESYGWSVGVPHTVYDGVVTPANIATAGLYIYTPWIGEGGGGAPGVGANYLFWNLWYNTFGFNGTQSPPSAPVLTFPGSDSAPGPIINTLTPLMQWQDVSNADYYVFWISKYPYGSNYIIYTSPHVSGTSTSFPLPSGTLNYNYKYRWNMRAYNSAGPSGISNTLYFQQTPSNPPIITVTSPSNGIVWNVGETRSITWTVSGDISNIGHFLLGYSIDGGANYNLVNGVNSTAPGTSRTYSWTVPNTPSTQCKILVGAIDANGNNLTVAVSGGLFTIQAIPTRIISLSGDLNFGNVQVGTTSTKTLTISNTGNSTLTVTSISYPAGFSGNWSGPISAGSSHDVLVTFSPTQAITYSGNLTVSSNKTSGTNTKSVSGTGTQIPTRIISLSGDLNFGNVQVGTTSTKTLTISNTGNSTLTVTSISYPAGFSGNWSGPISAGSSHDVLVTFSPTQAITYSGNLTVSSDKTSGTNTKSVSGTGTSTPTIGIVQLSSPSNGATLPPGNITFSWNSVSNATKYQFILYNSQGQVALDATKSNTSLIVTLGAEETITWKVRAGDNSGNWGAWSSTWSLTLKSTARIIRLEGDLNFGDVQVGDSAQRNLTIYNDGNSTLTVSSISYPTGFSGNWSGPISAGGSQNVTVTFSPTQAITYNGTLTVNSDKTSGTNTKSVSGTGVPTTYPLANLELTPSNQSVTVGNQATINVEVEEVTNLRGANITLNFDASKLQYVSSTNGGFIPSATLLEQSIDNIYGSVILDIASLTGFASGTGTIITVAFERIATGNTNITFGTTELRDKYNNTIVHTTGSGCSFVSCLGDFGGPNGYPDGVIDFEDLMIFALAYGSTPSDSNWNPVCDIAGPGGSLTPDEVIDFEDLMIFAMNYGKTCADL